MEGNSKSRVKVAGLMLTSIIVASLGYGFMVVNGLPVDIWRKDANGNVVLFPRTLTLDIASSTLTMGTMTLGDCVSTTWNPPSVATSSVNLAATSTDIAFSGIAMGNMCVGSLTSATSSAASVTCFVTGSGTTTLRLLNLGSTALDLATGTAKVCRIK